MAFTTGESEYFNASTKTSIPATCGTPARNAASFGTSLNNGSYVTASTGSFTFTAGIASGFYGNLDPEKGLTLKEKLMRRMKRA